MKSRNSPSVRLEHPLDITEALAISVHAVEPGLVLPGGREDDTIRHGQAESVAELRRSDRGHEVENEALLRGQSRS